MTLAMEELQERLKKTPSFTEACKLTVKSLRRLVPHFHWVGIYLRQGEELVLATWDGPEATKHTRIPIGKGICGLAAQTGETVIVDDVYADPRYLACFPQTRSEIVVPIFKEGEVIGEIDIDSDEQAAFTGDDRALLEEITALLAARHP